MANSIVGSCKLQVESCIHTCCSLDGRGLASSRGFTGTGCPSALCPPVDSLFDGDGYVLALVVFFTRTDPSTDIVSSILPDMDIELKCVDASDPLMRGFNPHDESMTEERVDTPYGSLLVALQGVDIRTNPKKKPVIVTYPDIGLNHITNYQAFFNFSDMKLLIEHMAVIHINAPGQEDNAPAFPSDLAYPTMDQLAEQVGHVLAHFKVTSGVVGFGVGLGANVLSRYALFNPAAFDGLFLMNATASKSSWSEWFYQKLNMYYLASVATSLTGSFPQTTQDYLMWHHFGSLDEDRNRDLVQIYRTLFSGKNLNARNLSLLIDSYIKRSDLGITRGDKEKNFKCQVLLMCGALAPHVGDTVAFNARLNPENSTWMKLSDCGMVLEELPAKVCEAFRLFLQGLGYSLAAYNRRRSSISRKESLALQYEIPLNGESMHIVENPIPASDA